MFSLSDPNHFWYQWKNVNVKLPHTREYNWFSSLMDLNYHAIESMCTCECLYSWRNHYLLVGYYVHRILSGAISVLLISISIITSSTILHPVFALKSVLFQVPQKNTSTTKSIWSSLKDTCWKNSHCSTKNSSHVYFNNPFTYSFLVMHLLYRPFISNTTSFFALASIGTPL